MVQKKSTYAILIAGILALCILGAGCTSQPTGPTTPTATPTPAPAAEYVFNETNADETVTLPVGSNITIRLEENPTTGYEWNVTASTGLQLVKETHDAPQTELLGAPGVHIWEYIAAEAGAGEFSAVYKRPWEETTGNETTFSMAFTIE